MRERRSYVDFLCFSGLFFKVDVSVYTYLAGGRLRERGGLGEDSFGGFSARLGMARGNLDIYQKKQFHER